MSMGALAMLGLACSVTRKLLVGCHQGGLAGVNGGCETFRARGEFAYALTKTLPLFVL